MHSEQAKIIELMKNAFDLIEQKKFTEASLMCDIGSRASEGFLPIVKAMFLALGGACLLRSGDNAAALKSLKSTLRLPVSYLNNRRLASFLHFTTGQAWLGAKNYKKAIKSFLTAHYRKEHPRILAWLAVSHLMKGNRSKALEAFESAKKIDLRYGDAQFFPLGALFEQDSGQKNVEALNEAISSGYGLDSTENLELKEIFLAPLGVKINAIRDSFFKIKEKILECHGRGMKKFSNGEFEESITIFDEGLNAIPREERDAGLPLIASKGLAFLATERYQGALECFQEAKRMVLNHPQHPNFKQIRAEVSFNQGQAWLGLEDVNEAKACLKECLKINPNHASALAHLGRALSLEGNHDEAMDLYEKSLLLDPKAETTHYFKAKTLFALKQYEQALDAINRAVVSIPATEYIELRKEILDELDMSHPGGLKEWKINVGSEGTNIDNVKVAAFSPKDDVTRDYTGREFFEKKFHENQAKEMLENAREKEIQQLLVKGKEHVERDEYDKASEIFTECLSIDENHAEALSLKGWARHKMGNLTDAFKLYELALDRVPINKEALASLVLFYVDLDRFEAAHDAIVEGLALWPEDERFKKLEKNLESKSGRVYDDKHAFYKGNLEKSGNEDYDAVNYFRHQRLMNQLQELRQKTVVNTITDKFESLGIDMTGFGEKVAREGLSIKTMVDAISDSILKNAPSATGSIRRSTPEEMAEKMKKLKQITQTPPRATAPPGGFKDPLKSVKDLVKQKVVRVLNDDFLENKQHTSLEDLEIAVTVHRARNDNEKELECALELLKRSPDTSRYWFFKARALNDLKRPVDALLSLDKSLTILSNSEESLELRKSILSSVHQAQLEEYQSKSTFTPEIREEELVTFKEARIPKKEASVLERIEQDTGKQFKLVEDIRPRPEAYSVKVEEIEHLEFAVKGNRITDLGLINCGLKKVPEGVKVFSMLNVLVLRKNELAELPEFVGDFEFLWNLSAERNALTRLPDSMNKLKNLMILDLDHNQFKTLSPAFLEMPNLRVVTLSDNPVAIVQDQESKNILERLKQKGTRVSPFQSVLPSIFDNE
ncbi:MAG: tetratricopeptide repeat protein [Candidatus Lokiarchaeota archaeon]|nr:tetratricopeptide repeat protein [Candidatus Lokiarchaeota archaeon]